MKNVWIKSSKSIKKILLKNIKKVVDKSKVVMYNHFCVTLKDVT